MNTDLNPQKKEDFRLEQLDDEYLLYHPNSKKIMYCNNTASLIWQLCDGTYSTAQIVDLLIETYPEAANVIEAEVIQTLTAFYEHEAIHFLDANQTVVSLLTDQ